MADADGISAMINPPGFSLNTIRAPFRRQRRSRRFQILVSGLVMRPLVGTKISQPAPQARCIGFGPGEPCSKAYSVGGAETAVGHSAAFPVSDQSCQPSPTAATLNTIAPSVTASGRQASRFQCRPVPQTSDGRGGFSSSALLSGQNGCQTTSMPSASGPFCPAFSVKRTRWFSCSVLNPARSTARMWTNTSLPP